MAKESLIILEGKVIKPLPNRMCEVSININGVEKTIICFLKGKINKRQDRIVPGIIVNVQLDTDFEISKGIVTGVKK